MGRTSNKREEILRFLTQFVAENGYAPSVREICAAVGLQSTATVHYHLGALREAGLIEMDDMKKRAITLPDAHRADRIPVVGVVTAGVPILAVEVAVCLCHYASVDAPWGMGCGGTMVLNCLPHYLQLLGGEPAFQPCVVGKDLATCYMVYRPRARHA